MKNITIENFDEWLFEYFEGELSNSDKTRLEDFVAKNPAYQEDFDLWGKSFTEANNIEVPIGIEKKFMRKNIFFNEAKAKLFWGASVLLIIVTVFVFSQQKQTEQKNGEQNLPAKKATTFGPSPKIYSNIKKQETLEITTNTTIKEVSQKSKLATEVNTDNELKKMENLPEKNVKLSEVNNQNPIQESSPVFEHQNTKPLKEEGVENTTPITNDKFEKKRKKPKNMIEPHDDTW